MKTISPSDADILSKLKIDSLNEMQLATIDAVGKNDNIVLLSATGSGKTLAFLFPLLRRLDASVKKNTGIGDYSLPRTRAAN